MPEIRGEVYKAATISGWGMAVPPAVRYNRFFLPFTPYKRVSEILARCGVQQRRVLSEGETTKDLATLAAERALETAGVPVSSVDCIIAANTIPPNMAFPVAASVQEKLDARGAAVFDVRAACPGFIKALEVAACFVDSGGYSNVLVIGVETPSGKYEEAPRIAMLFGDGAGAVLVSRSHRPKPWVFSWQDDGRLGGILSWPDGEEPIFMGPRVFVAAADAMTQTTLAVLEKAGLTLEDISLLVPHQANSRIIERMAAELGLTNRLGRLSRKVYMNIRLYGNTSEASIPIALVEAVQKRRLKPGRLVALTAAGAGMTAGAVILEW
jgi:3-oxoacyl-[acyl-carrier-protein] synthase-3